MESISTERLRNLLKVTQEVAEPEFELKQDEQSQPEYPVPRLPSLSQLRKQRLGKEPTLGDV